MQFILGLLSGLVFLLCLVTAFYLGYKQGLKKPKAIPIDDEEKRKMKQFDDHFKALFSYDVSKALQRKKVR